MELPRVLEQFASLAGLERSEAWRYSGLAEAVIAQVTARLRPDVDPAAESTRLSYLCAAVCYYKYALLQGGACEESVRALDVTVSQKLPDRCNSAQSIRDDALLLARDLLRDDQFFCGTCGSTSSPFPRRSL